MKEIYYIYIYIGKTINLPQRMSAHFSLNTVENEPWKKLVDQKNIVIYKCASKTDLDIYETYFINTLKPLYNKDKVFYDLPSFELPELQSTIYIYSPYKKTNKSDGKTGLAFLKYIELRSKENKQESDIEQIKELESEYSNFSRDYLTEKKDSILMEKEIIDILNGIPERVRVCFADSMSFTNTYSKFDYSTNRFSWK